MSVKKRRGDFLYSALAKTNHVKRGIDFTCTKDLLSEVTIKITCLCYNKLPERVSPI
jgi:hypothetical protein